MHVSKFVLQKPEVLQVFNYEWLASVVIRAVVENLQTFSETTAWHYTRYDVIDVKRGKTSNTKCSCALWWNNS